MYLWWWCNIVNEMYAYICNNQIKLLNIFSTSSIYSLQGLETMGFSSTFGMLFSLLWGELPTLTVLLSPN